MREDCPMSETDEDVARRERLRALGVFQSVRATFDARDVPEQPVALLARWLDEAIDACVREPHAMSVATVDEDGRPASRMLILKGLADGQMQFASNRSSRKGRELDAAPWAAITVYWSEQGRQVRARGRVLDLGPEAGAADVCARPADSRAAALASPQSEVLDRPEDVDAAFAEARERIERDPRLVAADWALYSLVPDELEFWQADPERRHVRLRYLLDGDGWRRELLWP